MLDVEEMDMSKEAGAFENFKLSSGTVDCLREHGIEYLFPVQVSTFRPIFRGHNVIVKSRTGTGKTLAFCLPIIERLMIMAEEEEFRSVWPLCLILAPTRELAKQTSDTLGWLSSLKTECVYGGGMSVFAQADHLRRKRPVIVVGTPGRIKDQLERNSLSLSKVRFVVLDECDRMLDMGFKDDVEAILNYVPYKDAEAPPQTLVFSATIPSWLSAGALNKYCTSSSLKTKWVDLVGDASNQTSVSVQHLAIQCEFSEREQTIANVLRCHCGAHRQAIVFCDTKKMADTLSTSRQVHLNCHVLHGDIPQDKRELVMKGFLEGRYRVLVTTDVAARGLDIPNVDLVVVTSPPTEPDTYVHRSGRTGRAGRPGTCICLYKAKQKHELNELERCTNLQFKRIPAPTAPDLISASVNDAIHSIEEIADDVRNKFIKSAKKILSKMEPTYAIAAALAVISSSQNTDTSASILSGKSGFITYHFQTTKPFQSCSVIVFFLRRVIGGADPDNGNKLDNRKDVGKILFTRDKLNAFVEINCELQSIIDRNWRNSNTLSMKVAENLPDELVTPDELFQHSSFSNNDDRRNSNGYRKRNSNNWSNNQRLPYKKNSYQNKKFRRS